MSSGYPNGHAHQDYYTNINMNMNINNNVNGRSMSTYRSPLAGILNDRRQDLIGKRSLAEFQHQQHQQQQLLLQQQASFYLRNVKPRSYSSNNNLADFSTSSALLNVPRYGVPVMQNYNNNLGMMGTNIYQNTLRAGGYSLPAHVPAPVKQAQALVTNNENNNNNNMMKHLQELEKQLLLDDEDVENDVSGVTNSEWSEMMSPPVILTKAENNILSPSPTSSSSSSCASTSASPAGPVNINQLLTEAAGAITDGKQDTASEILTRASKYSNARGTPEQRLCFNITTALKTRMSVNEPKTTSDLYGKDHILSTQLLYDKSPCFKLGFIAANNAILEAGKKIHVLDFDIGNGVQYMYLLNEIAAAREAREARGDDIQTPFTLKLTTMADFGNGGVERLKLVGEGLKELANKLGVTFSYNVLNLKLCEINTTSLAVENDEVLVVNFAFKLFRLPDESVTTENLRDEVLRRVKGLSPALVTVVEQELNGNTALFETRVSQACGYYLALLESLDATIGRDHSDRVKIDEGLSRKIMNSVACEGRDRVERCEVFGKWRVRMSMAGFKPKVMSQLGDKANSVTCGNPGFTVKEEGGGISLGWMGRTLTVASTWH